MPKTLRDSTAAADIPLEGLDAVAGYGDGSFMWTSEEWARFDPAHIVPLSIVTHSGSIGDIADCEAEDFTPPEAAMFVSGFNRGTRRPTLYVNRTIWPDYVAALQAAGLNPTGVDWWVATLDGTQNVWYGTPGVVPPPGLQVVAIQWKGQAQTGGHYDESVILVDAWLGAALPPAPAPPPVPHSGATYTVVGGDTLSGIAARFGMSWQALYDFGNNRAVVGPDPNLIFPGQVLDVPSPNPPPPPARHTYTVVPEDTLSGIADRFGMNWQALYDFGNNRAVVGPDPNLIFPGQVLDVP